MSWIILTDFSYLRQFWSLKFNFSAVVRCHEKYATLISLDFTFLDIYNHFNSNRILKWSFNIWNMFQMDLNITRNANVRRNESKFIRNGFDKLEMILNWLDGYGSKFTANVLKYSLKFWNILEHFDTSKKIIFHISSWGQHIALWSIWHDVITRKFIKFHILLTFWALYFCN